LPGVLPPLSHVRDSNLVLNGVAGAVETGGCVWHPAANQPRHTKERKRDARIPLFYQSATGGMNGIRDCGRTTETSNIEHSTSNVQVRKGGIRFPRHLDVGCSMLDVGCFLLQPSLNVPCACRSGRTCPCPPRPPAAGRGRRPTLGTADSTRTRSRARRLCAAPGTCG